jgi:hypothetical protein
MACVVGLHRIMLGIVDSCMHFIAASVPLTLGPGVDHSIQQFGTASHQS